MKEARFIIGSMPFKEELSSALKAKDVEDLWECLGRTLRWQGTPRKVMFTYLAEYCHENCMIEMAWLRAHKDVDLLKRCAIWEELEWHCINERPR